MDKVKYGLKNVHYAVATVNENNEATYATPVAIPGAVSLSLDAEGGTTKFRADNIDYWIGQSNNGYSGDLEIALIPDSFRKDVLGDFEDANGIMMEDSDAKTKYFALLFQFEGDEKNTRHVMYKCSASRPSVAGNTTEEEIEPQTETLSLTASTIHNAALNKNIVKGKCSETNTAKYNNWFNAVYQATGSASTYQVTFDSNGGSAVASQSVTSGSKATQPTDPTLADHTFDGWYSDAGLTQAYDFDTLVYADITLYAKWIED